MLLCGETRQASRQASRQAFVFLSWRFFFFRTSFRFFSSHVLPSMLWDRVACDFHSIRERLPPAFVAVSEASVQAGSAATAALDWNDPAALEALNPPFDLVLAADCVYAEEAVVPFLFVTKRALLGRKRDGFKAQAVVVNEFRSHAVHDEFMARAKESFTVKRVPNSRLDPAFEHPLIHVYSLALKKDAEGAAKIPGAKPDQPSPAKAGTSQVPAETEPKTRG